jgi:hypothetical protein
MTTKLTELAALIVEDLSEELERREVYFTGPSESLSCDERDKLLSELVKIVMKTLRASGLK